MGRWFQNPKQSRQMELMLGILFLIISVAVTALLMILFGIPGFFLAINLVELMIPILEIDFLFFDDFMWGFHSVRERLAVKFGTICFGAIILIDENIIPDTFYNPTVVIILWVIGVLTKLLGIYLIFSYRGCHGPNNGSIVD